jgi:hypothetical protein
VHIAPIELTWLVLLYFITCDVLSIMYMVFLDDGDRLHGSILVRLYYFLRQDVLYVVDSQR